MVRDPSSTTDQPIFILQPKEPIPSRFGFIIGDCFQNLRSSLDYLVRELVIAAGNKPTDREMFPICKTPKGFKGAVERGQLEGIPADAFKEIESIQPYNLGDDWEKSTLWVVDELTNINKHRRVPLTMLRGAQSHSAVPLGIGPFEFTLDTSVMPVFDENAKLRPVLDTQKMERHFQAFACITFDEGPAKGMEVTLCINEWMAYILNDVVRPIARFL